MLTAADMFLTKGIAPLSLVFRTAFPGVTYSAACVKGADSSERQRIRPYLIQFLKGSNIQREALQAEQPSLYTYFEKVWRLRNNHMVQGLPAQYIFYLLCSNCKDPDCPHTICPSGRQEVPTWYEHGPTVSYLPLPIPDTSYPWGSTCSAVRDVVMVIILSQRKP